MTPPKLLGLTVLDVNSLITHMNYFVEDISAVCQNRKYMMLLREFGKKM